MFAAKFAKAAMTMIAMITVPPKKAMFGERFICVDLSLGRRLTNMLYKT